MLDNKTGNINCLSSQDFNKIMFGTKAIQDNTMFYLRKLGSSHILMMVQAMRKTRERERVESGWGRESEWGRKERTWLLVISALFPFFFFSISQPFILPYWIDWFYNITTSTITTTSTTTASVFLYIHIPLILHSNCYA